MKPVQPKLLRNLTKRSWTAEKSSSTKPNPGLTVETGRRGEVTPDPEVTTEVVTEEAVSAEETIVVAAAAAVAVTDKAPPTLRLVQDRLYPLSLIWKGEVWGVA